MKTRAHEKDSSIARLTKISSAIGPRAVTERSARATSEAIRTAAAVMPGATVGVCPEAAAASEVEAAVSEAADGGVNRGCWGWSRGANRLQNAGPQTLVQVVGNLADVCGPCLFLAARGFQDL